MQIDPKEFRPMIIYAFRYALGRRSYSVGEMTAIIKRYWAELSEHDRALIKGEIGEAIKTDRAGDLCDQREWMGVLDLTGGGPQALIDRVGSIHSRV